MKQYYLLVIICTVFFFDVDAQNAKKAEVSKHKLLSIYKFEANYIKPSACEINLMQRYGFQEKHHKPAKKKMHKKLVNQNIKNEEKLIIRNGKFWKIKYEKGLKKCKENEGKTNSEWNLAD